MVVGYALAFLISFVVIVWTTLDLIWSFITNRDDLEADSTPAVWINAVLSWSISQTIYAFTGGADGEWIALPSSDTTM